MKVRASLTGATNVERLQVPLLLFLLGQTRYTTAVDPPLDMSVKAHLLPVGSRGQLNLIGFAR